MRTLRTQVDSRTFQEAMARLAAPVTVVTTAGPDGRPHGTTVSPVITVSLAPPLVLVSVSRAVPCHRVLATADEFVVNVLGTRHHDLGRRFATWPGPGADLPCVPGAHVQFRCASSGVLTAGDHDLLVGAVLDVRVAGEPDSGPPARADADRPGPERLDAPALSGLATLSAREDEVALLVVRGLTNQQVAARLGLSPHTVNFHLRNIYRKLSISTRVALVRLLAQPVSSTR